MTHGDELSDRDSDDGVSPEHIAIKFEARTRLPYNEEALSALSRLGLIDWRELTENFGNLRLAPPFESQSVSN